jgi:hypothetical protein
MRGLIPSGNENFVLMDSTHVMSAWEHLGSNEKGYKGVGDFGKQVRLMYVLSEETFPAYLLPSGKREHDRDIQYVFVCKGIRHTAGGIYSG